MITTRGGPPRGAKDCPPYNATDEIIDITFKKVYNKYTPTYTLKS